MDEKGKTNTKNKYKKKTNDYIYNYSEELDISWPKRLTYLQ